MQIWVLSSILYILKQFFYILFPTSNNIACSVLKFIDYQAIFNFFFKTKLVNFLLLPSVNLLIFFFDILGLFSLQYNSFKLPNLTFCYTYILLFPRKRVMWFTPNFILEFFLSRNSIYRSNKKFTSKNFYSFAAILIVFFN